MPLAILWFVGAFVVVAVLIVLFLAWRVRLFNVRRRLPHVACDLHWEDLAPTPLGEKRYTPQGLTCVDDRVIFANTWKNTRSRVYEFDSTSLAEPRRWFDMPDGAVHTSGLTWDGQYVWAVDYKSNRAYCIDLEPSLAAGEVTLVGSFDTTLKGTSAACMVPWEGQRLLAISDFMNSGRTIFVDQEKALASGTAAGVIRFVYRNEGFSQGLTFIGGCLYESENKAGIDVVNRMDLEKLRQAGDSRAATITQFPTPFTMVEDLAWDGKYLYTSDESSFRFYRARLPAAVLGDTAGPS